MELIDQVDWNENIVAVRSRDDLKKEMFIHKAVLVIPKSKDNKFIFSKRSKTQYPFPDTWCCGVGGKVMHDESYESAAIRECLEEANFKFDLEFVTKVHYDFDDYKAIFNIYTSKEDINLEQLVSDPREVQFFKLMTLDEMNSIFKKYPNSLAPTFRIIFPEFVKNIKK